MIGLGETVVVTREEEPGEQLTFAEIVYELGTGGPIRRDLGWVLPSSDEASLVYVLTEPTPEYPFPPKVEVYRRYLITVREQPKGHR